MKITLQPSGHAFEVAPKQTILNAALAAGFSLPYSCRTGCCSTCKARVVDGSIDQGLVLEKHLSRDERDRGYALLCSAYAASDCTIEIHELEGLAAVQPKLYPARIAKLERIDDVTLLQLRMPLNENMHFIAGQYVDLLVNNVRRSYSIANPPDPNGLPFVELHVRHYEQGAASHHLHTIAKERDMVKLEGPYGTFFLRESTKPVILLASGTGFAPIKAIVEHALRTKSTRDFTLYWGGKVYRRDLVETWPIKAHFPDGFPHLAVLKDHPDLSNHQVYACGAPAMVDAARADFIAHGLPADEFFADAFIAKE
ncbi:MAG: 2Fe-2S iron-sulfur cluster-binding protein [Kofleriaceae bacterium]